MNLRKTVQAASLALLLTAGCNETFRTIVIPQVSGGGDPETSKIAVVISQGATPTSDGFGTTFNLSGDTNIGQATLGQIPTFAVPFTGSLRTAVSNSGSSNLTIYTTRSPQGGQPTTVTLPVGSTPNNLVVTGSTSSLYAPFPTHDTVGVIDLINSIFRTEISVCPVPGTTCGANPVFVNGPTDVNKVYVANQGNGTVSVMDSAINVKLTDIVVGSQPSWITIVPTNTATVPISPPMAYVVNQGSGTVSVINTSTDTVTATVNVGAGPTFSIFDRKLLRVYVVNTAGNSISIINADPLSPGYNTATTVAVGSSPAQVAALPDGSRVYVTNSGSGTVSVINTTGNNVVKTITVGTSPGPIAASPDSLKVIVGFSDTTLNKPPNAVAFIRTSDDTITASLPTPGKPVYIYTSQ